MAKKPMFEIDKDSEVTGTGNGYVYVTTTPDYSGPGIKKMKDHKKKYVPRARALVELSIGRFIDPDKEEIHHKNEDVTDDSPSNLELKTRGEHSRGHAKKNKFWKKSPRIKPGVKRASILRVISQFLDRTQSSKQI
jgi:hypothetical protein